MILTPYITENLQHYHNIKHGFFTRNGGVSTGEYASLNTSYKSPDDHHNVQINRKRIAKYFGIEANKLITVTQTHSNKAVVISKDNYKDNHIADAIITKERKLAIGILTADCTPILIYDYENQIISAIHSGWKSAVSNIIENTVKEMINIGGNINSMIAAIGPTISQKNYEVDYTFYNNILNINKQLDTLFIAQENGKFLFDLLAYNANTLSFLGIESKCLNLCTYENKDDFFSYRRTYKQNNIDCGRQISAIMLL